jgi:DNA-binding SARP family transcriptional activator
MNPTGRLPIELRALGAPSVRRAGTVLAFDTRKALALLVYLAVEEHAHTRDALAALLWPEGDPEHARGALRRTLSAVRKAVGPEALEVNRSSVAITALVSNDVAAFENGLKKVRVHHPDGGAPCPECMEQLEDAVRLYRGRFLSGWGFRDAPGFEEWRFLQEESLQRELGEALRGLVAGYAEQGSYGEAVTWARRWTEHDPLHEPAHVALMRLSALAGDREGALKQYSKFTQVLEQELGVAPLEETLELNHRIASGALDDLEVAARPSGGDTKPILTLPFEGRGRESGVLEAARRAGPGGRIVLIEGEAGIGKTRLVHEVARRAVLEGARFIEVGNHQEESDHAYGLVARLLASLTAELPARRLSGLEETVLVELGRLVPEVRAMVPDLPPAAPLGDPGVKTAFFAALAEVVGIALHDESVPIVLLDDLQWADGASLDVLAYLARRIEELHGLFVLTWRSGEATPLTALRKPLAEARRLGRLGHLILARLGPDEVTRIVSACLPDVPSDMAARVHEESEGVPFFVASYVGLLTAAPSSDIELPQDALDIVRDRLEPLGGATRQVISAASVLGRSFDAGLVQGAAGRSDEETIDALEELVARGLIAESSGGTTPSYDFTHEKIRSLVYDDLSLARRRLLHSRAADLLLAPRARPRPGDLALAAYHLEQAGRPEAAELHRQAGEAARELFANAEALAHLERAVALGHPEPAAIHSGIGDLEVLLGRYEVALRSYEAALEHAEGDAARTIERKIAGVRLRRGEWEVALGHLRSALELTPAEDPGRAEVLADISLALSGRDDREAGEVAREAIAAADPASRARAQGHNLLGMIARRAGRRKEALTHLKESLKAAEALGDVSAEVAALNNLALVQRDAADVEASIALTERALELCTKRGDLHRQAALHNNLADLLHVAGRTEDSQRHAKEAARLFSQVGEGPTGSPEIWKLTEW